MSCITVYHHPIHESAERFDSVTITEACGQARHGMAKQNELLKTPTFY